MIRLWSIGFNPQSVNDVTDNVDTEEHPQEPKRRCEVFKHIKPVLREEMSPSLEGVEREDKSVHFP
jgi:hypothetical protein